MDMPSFEGILAESKDQQREHIEQLFPGREALIKDILTLIGEDVTREGLVDTPFRVIKSWLELYKGYRQSPADILNCSFQEGMEKMTDEIVICKNIEFTSMCEHHMLPFTGIAHVGYLPDKKVVGLSKIPRLVECFGCRLQIQEKMCTQIADSFMEFVEPAGVGVIIEAKHLCVGCRGIKKPTTSMITSAMRGKFKSQTQTRNEFLQLIK